MSTKFGVDSSDAHTKSQTDHLNHASASIIVGKCAVSLLQWSDQFYSSVHLNVPLDVPNSGRGLPRLGYRTQEWDVDFRNYLKKLDATKPVILCGDLNVAHHEIGNLLSLVFFLVWISFKLTMTILSLRWWFYICLCCTKAGKYVYIFQYSFIFVWLFIWY